MDCAEALAKIPEALTGSRDPALEAHVVTCEPCRRQVEQVERVLASLRRSSVPEGEVLVPSFDSVLLRVRARPRVPRMLLRAAALLLAALAGAAVDRAALRGGPKEPAPNRKREEARAVIAERPGGMGASLAALRAMAR